MFDASPYRTSATDSRAEDDLNSSNTDANAAREGAAREEGWYKRGTRVKEEGISRKREGKNRSKGGRKVGRKGNGR